MAEKEHVGGRLAANPRKANIAEGLAVQRIRPFAAVAPVPREEDHGIDIIATLFRREGPVLTAEDSFYVQVKTYTAAKFEFKGNGVEWLRQLRLPYFPLVAKLDTATVSLHTLNRWHRVIHSAKVPRYVFVPEDDGDDEDYYDLFPMTENLLMTWSISDCAHEEFPIWAYSILKPAIRIEANNQLYGPMRHLIKLDGGPYEFKDRGKDGKSINPPHPGELIDVPLGDGKVIYESLRHTIGPFAHWASNYLGGEHAQSLIELRDSLRNLGLDPDPENSWDELAKEMVAYSERQEAKPPSLPAG